MTTRKSNGDVPLLGGSPLGPGGLNKSPGLVGFPPPVLESKLRAEMARGTGLRPKAPPPMGEKPPPVLGAFTGERRRKASGHSARFLPAKLPSRRALANEGLEGDLEDVGELDLGEARPEFDEELAKRSDLNPRGMAPVDEVGGVQRARPDQKDPFARLVKEPGALEPWAWKVEEIGPDDPKHAERVFKTIFKDAMDPVTRIVRTEPGREVLGELGRHDPKFTDTRSVSRLMKAGASEEEIAAVKSGQKAAAGVYDAFLRTMRGSHPKFVNEAAKQLPVAREMWRRQMFGKLNGTSAWLLEQNPTEEAGIARRALRAAELAKEKGDDMALELASRAAYNARKGKLFEAKQVLAQHDLWLKPGATGSEEWLRTFNPRKAEWVESTGGELAPAWNEGRFVDTRGRGMSYTEALDADGRMARVRPPEEVRPGVARSAGQGSEMVVEEMPKETWEYRTTRPSPPPEWRQLMHAHRRLENEAIRLGMPKNLRGTSSAAAWIGTNMGQLEGELHTLMQSVRDAKGAIPEMPASRAGDIITSLLDEGVTVGKGSAISPKLVRSLRTVEGVDLLTKARKVLGRGTTLEEAVQAILRVAAKL